jgi:hypothetical protein
MGASQILDAIASAQWFTRLGEAEVSHFVVPIKDLSGWREFLSSAEAREFGVDHPGRPGFPYSAMSWLPTSSSETDPIHGTTLATVARDRGLEPEFVAAKLAAFSAATQSQRSCGEIPALKCGGTDLSAAALSGARMRAAWRRLKPYLEWKDSGARWYISTARAIGPWPYFLTAGLWSYKWTIEFNASNTIAGVPKIGLPIQTAF